MYAPSRGLEADRGRSACISRAERRSFRPRDPTEPGHGVVQGAPADGFDQLESDFTKALDTARQERIDAGQQPYAKELQEHFSQKEMVAPLRVLLALIAAGATVAGVAKAAPALLPITKTHEDIRTYQKMHNYMLAHVKNSATSLADGIDNLLKRVVRKAGKSRADDDDRGITL